MQPFVLTALSCDPVIVRAADEAGVDRIGIDIERLNKSDRQLAADYRISEHRLEDLAIVRANVTRAQVFIRLNPLNEGTAQEIDRCLELGAEVVMLPYFSGPRDAARFLHLLGGRATPVLLVETAAAAARIHDLVALPGVSEVMLGLNDLHMSLGLRSPFQVLLDDVARTVSAQVRGAGLRFGFGGVTRPGQRGLPVAPDLIYAQYARLGGTAAWLSRSFFRGIEPHEIPAQVQKIRARLDFWFEKPQAVLEGQRERLAATLAGRGACAS